MLTSVRRFVEKYPKAPAAVVTAVVYIHCSIAKFKRKYDVLRK